MRPFSQSWTSLRGGPVSAALLTGLVLAVAPAAVAEELGAAAEESDAAAEEPAEDGPMDAATLAGVVTAGGGVAAAITVGAMAFLSPLCCALPYAAPCGAAALGGGALVGSAVVSDWECGQIWFPTLVGGIAGGLAGLLAGVGALLAANLTGTAINYQGFDPLAARASDVTSASVAAAVGTGIMLLGAAAGGVLVTMVYDLEPEEVASGAEAAATPTADASPEARLTSARAALAY